MVLDTSVLVALLQSESDAELIARIIEEGGPMLISAATVVELGVVMVARHGPKGGQAADLLLREMKVTIVAVTEVHADLAREGFIRYGKGRHPAQLNFGDCFSYALAKASGRPLLFKGNGFDRTDVMAARPAPLT